MGLNKTGRELVARKRLRSVLDRHKIATARTLEQKISDAGPNNLRIDPHVLTVVRNALVDDGVLRIRKDRNTPWYYQTTTDGDLIQERFDAQVQIHRDAGSRLTVRRLGQCLEITVYRALCEQEEMQFLGAFRDLADHDDSALYAKEEPPRSVSGRHLSGDQRLDFLVMSQTAGPGGIEVKNVREWFYPQRDEIRDLLAKALAIDCVPILIARRIHFTTFKVLKPCGVILHQTYNQRWAEADRDLAERARDKLLLGYHDIRVGNAPDDRLLRFIGTNLPKVMPEARQRFEDHKDLIEAYADGAMAYEEFAARVRRRAEGTNEDNDWDGIDWDAIDWDIGTYE